MPKIDPFAAYKLPSCIADTVEIELEGTPAVFTVKLPSSMDDDYQMAVMRDLSFETIMDDVTGEIRSSVDPLKMQKVRKDVFFRQCIKGAVGLPKGMTPQEFFETYPLAAKAVFETASDQALVAEQEAQEALGKLKTSPGGKSSGQESTISTKDLSPQG